jgi:cytidine kinase
MSLVVTGTVGIDTVITPTGKAEGVLGGSCTYFAAASSFYTKPVRVVAAVGGDFPDDLRAMMSKFPGVDLSGLQTRPGSKSFRWGGQYRPDMNGRDTLFTELGVLLEPPPPVPAAYRDSQMVFLANSHPAVQLDFLSHFSQRKLAVADTMDLWINTAKDDLIRLMKVVDGLVLNFDEAELFTGKKNPVTAARLMLEYGPRFVVVKKGEHGALIIHRDGVAALPAYPAEQVIDPTGAGDTFAGGMMGYLASKSNEDAKFDPGSFAAIQSAIAHGTIVASFNIESFTLSRLLTLTKTELDNRMREFARIVKF